MSTFDSQRTSAEDKTSCADLTEAGTCKPVVANVDQSEPTSDIGNDTYTIGTPVQGDGTGVDIAKKLDSLQPSERTRKRSSFHENYQSIEAALARGVTQGAVRAALKKGGLSLSAATFRKMLEAERQQNQTTPDEQAPSVAEDPPSSAFAEAGAI